MTVSERFWAKVDKGSAEECWPWLGGRNSSAYGSFSLDGKPARAHRVAYTLEKGPIPEGLMVCHTCDNPVCCNPNHLWVGSAADNNRDKTAKGRNVRPPRDESSVNYTRGENSSFAKLNTDDVRDIRNRRANGERVKDIAAQYGIDRTLVWMINARKVWAHVD